MENLCVCGSLLLLHLSSVVKHTAVSFYSRLEGSVIHPDVGKDGLIKVADLFDNSAAP